MTGRGLYRGQAGNWQTYKARPRVVTIGGGSTQVVSTTDGLGSSGRYMELPGGTVIAQAIIGFELFQSAGVGDAYLLSLPRPVDRQAYPMVEGTGFAYQGSHMPVPIMALAPRLVPPGVFIELDKGDEDNYMAFQFPFYLEAGTATIPGGGAITSVSISYTCAWTPKAAEFTITPTSLHAGAGTMCFPWMVQNISSTTATISARGTTGIGFPIDFSWKLNSVPVGSNANTLIGPGKPFLWSGLDGIYAQFSYASRAGA